MVILHNIQNQELHTNGKGATIGLNTKERKKTMAIIISGCPRSGTSVCMDLHKSFYGEDKIIGSKFPQENLRFDLDYFLNNGFNIDMAEYLLSKNEKIQSLNFENGDSKDLNPNGFWECVFSVQGLYYSHRAKDLMEKAKQPNTIIKVVSQGLLNSNPELIDKIVFMLRHPRAVAKSQERLRRKQIVKSEKGTFDIYKDLEHRDDDGNLVNDELIVHSAEMFIQVTKQAMQFIIQNPDIPILLVDFDNLITDPETQIKRIYDFNNIDGDYEAGLKVVDKKLNRSKHQDIKHDLWEDAEFLFEQMHNYFDSDKDIEILKSALTEMQNPHRPINIMKRVFKCYRAKLNANYSVCKQCLNDKYYRQNLKARSIEIDKAGLSPICDSWQMEPCLFECGLDINQTKPITIQESIQNNSWNDVIIETEKEIANVD